MEAGQQWSIFKELKEKKKTCQASILYFNKDIYLIVGKITMFSHKQKWREQTHKHRRNTKGSVLGKRKMVPDKSARRNKNHLKR